MECIFGQGVFSEGGGDCGNEVDPLRVYPIDIVESRDVVEERGPEEVPVLLENTTLCREEQEGKDMGGELLTYVQHILGLLD